MDASMRNRAREATRTTNIDTILGLSTMLKHKDAAIDPTAIPWRNRELHAPLKDTIIAHVPDLLDLAIYAWYKLQEEGE